jgi:hypothetical protein
LLALGLPLAFQRPRDPFDHRAFDPERREADDAVGRAGDADLLLLEAVDIAAARLAPWRVQKTTRSFGSSPLVSRTSQTTM